jgi:hypothetical protein
MIYELRIYRFHPSKKREFLKGFRKAKAFMEKYGITFVAAWENCERNDEFIWIRAFPSMRAREVSTSNYYNSPEWLKIVDTMRPAVRHRVVRIMNALPFSPLK